MNEADAVDILRRLIVGKRGRARATKLLCVGSDGGVRPITVAPRGKGNPTRYAPMIAPLDPVRIEAYAGDELLDVWADAEREAQPVVERERPRKVKKKHHSEDLAVTSKVLPLTGGGKSVLDLATHFASLLSSAYAAHGAQLAAAHKTNAERDAKIFDQMRDIAQHHSDRAGLTDVARAETEKALRITQRQNLELQGLVLKMQAKVAEVAAAGEGDQRTQAFMQLLTLAQSQPTTPAHANGNGNGAARPRKAAKETTS